MGFGGSIEGVRVGYGRGWRPDDSNGNRLPTEVAR